MANRAKIDDLRTGKISKQEQAARIAEEQAWRVGKLEDYTPMAMDDYGLIAFDTIARAIPAPKLAEVDGYTIEQAADCLAKAQQLRAAINEMGLIEAVEQGKLWTAYHKALDTAKKWMVELGCTPSARAKIAMDAAAAITKPKTTRAALLENDE